MSIIENQISDYSDGATDTITLSSGASVGYTVSSSAGLTEDLDSPGYTGFTDNFFQYGTTPAPTGVVFDQAVIGVIVEYSALDNLGYNEITIDGVVVDLNTLIASGDAVFTQIAGTGAIVDAAGNLTGNGPIASGFSGGIGQIEFLIPVTSLSVIHAPYPSTTVQVADVIRFAVSDSSTIGMACFTRSTHIKTQSGECLIEDLSKGDMVLTMDNGYQPIRWVGSSKVAAKGDLAPILIRKGALGNDRDLRVSPQHRMLLRGGQAEMMFGETEVLATAKSLINDHSIMRVEGGEVEYFHMLFDTHEIVWAEGAPSESFHPGEQGWKALDQATRDEILTLLPQLQDDAFKAYGPSARMSLKHKEGQLLGRYITEGNTPHA